MKNVSKILRDARERQGLKQVDVAKVFKYKSAQYVSNWERGLASPPFDKLPKLLKTLGIPRTKFTAAYLDDCRRDLEQCFK